MRVLQVQVALHAACDGSSSRLASAAATLPGPGPTAAGHTRRLGVPAEIRNSPAALTHASSPGRVRRLPRLLESYGPASLSVDSTQSDSERANAIIDHFTSRPVARAAVLVAKPRRTAAPSKTRLRDEPVRRRVRAPLAGSTLKTPARPEGRLWPGGEGRTVGASGSQYQWNFSPSC